MNLLAECNYIKQMIADCPQDAFISRISLESRLKTVQHEAEELKKRLRFSSLIQGTISFRGKPVIDCYGIEASFSAEAIKKFETIIAAKAASYATQLSGKGKLPKRDQYRLIITGTVRGSFGFKLENQVPAKEFPDCQDASSYFEDAVNNTIDFF
jgi:hypothetical protein